MTQSWLKKTRARCLRSFFLATCLLALPTPGFAQADDSVAREAARAHFEKGSTLAQEQRFDEAAREYELAYKLIPHAATLYNLGQAYLALGELPEAVHALERHVKLSKNASTRARAREQLARLETQIGRVQIQVTPPAAQVHIDGHLLATPSLDGGIALRPGIHEVSAYLVGYTPASARIEVAADQRINVVLALAPTPRPPSLSASSFVLISCPVPDVTVSLDKRELEDWTTPQVLTQGAHMIEFRRQGYTTDGRKILVPEAGSLQVECDLQIQPKLLATESGKLSVIGPIRGTEIRVNDAPFKPGAPLPLGAHSVSVQKSGTIFWKGSTQIDAGQVTVVNIEDSEVLERRTESKRRQRLWGGILMGVGVGVGAGAIALQINNGSRFSTFEAEQEELRKLAVEDPQNSELESRVTSNDELNDTIQIVDRVVIGMGTAAVALLAGGVVLYFTGREKASPPLSASITRSGGQVFWMGAF